jgi:mRNA-degrading endonuclease RelE of RelBE toxin-antitoxin system
VFHLEITESARDDLRFLKPFEQRRILDAIGQQLLNERLTATRHRKPLRPNDLSAWELRVGIYRIFYDVEEESATVRGAISGRNTTVCSYAARSICLKLVELTTIAPALAELLDLAGEDTLILKTSEGREFVLAEVDDFDTEIAMVRQNEELMALLAERSREKKTYTLQQVREQLGLA